MTNRRIGTLTVGVFLVTLGVLLIIQLITHIGFAHALIEVWPVILVALGAEILYHRFRTSQDDKMRYDIISMIVLFLVGISAIGLYTLQASGLLDVVRNIPSYATYSIDIAPDQIPVNGDIDRVVLENNSANLRVKVAESSDVEIRGSMSMLATSRDEASRLIKDDKGYSVRRQGRDLIIETHQAEPEKWFLHNGVVRSPLEVTMPANLALEIDSISGNIDVVADKAEKDWFVKENNGSLDITLPVELNANIIAEASGIVGDLPFKEQDEIASKSNNGTSTDLNDLQNRRFEIQLGQGGPRLHLVSSNGTVAVYQR